MTTRQGVPIRLACCLWQARLPVFSKYDTLNYKIQF